MPAIPFFAIAVAAVARGSARELVRWPDRGRGGRLLGRRSRQVPIAAVIIVAAAIAAARLPALERDPARLADLDRISMVAPRGATVGICANVNGNWLLHAWMQRRFLISLDATGTKREWFLKTDGDEACAVPACQPMSPPGRLTLLRCP